MSRVGVTGASRRSSGARWLPAALWIGAVLGCNGDSPAGAESPEPTVDQALVGTWNGTITQPDLGVMGGLTVILATDGRMTVTSDNPQFHPIPNGTWGVFESRFSGSGLDAVGTNVRFSAPSSSTRLDGTWIAGRVNGVFTVMKQ